MSSETDAILAYAGAQADSLLRALVEVCDQNSGTGNLPGVLAMLDRFEAMFRACGLEHGGRVVGREGRTHLVLRGGSADPSAPSVLLVGHVDTVYPVDHPFQRVELRGHRAHGPGVSDMKGGLLVAAHTVAALRSAGLLDRGRFVAFINSDEEVQSPTSRHLLEGLCQAERFDAALVFEGGRKNGNLVSARKGVGKYVLTSKGRAAHSGINHEAGVNAIEELASKVLKIQRLTDYTRGVTLNVGVFHGGLGRNTVAPEARCEVDLRVWQADDAARVDEAVRRIAAETLLEGATTTCEGGLGRPPWPQNVATERLVALWKAAGIAAGIPVDAEATGGGSDGNFTHALGVATLDALGPTGGNPHTPEEYIEIPSLVERVVLHATALARLLENAR